MNVVFIDDEEVILGLLKEIFLDFFAEAEFFSDENEAIDFIVQKKDHIDLVVCDFKMKNLDGIKVLKTLRERRVETKFILFSAFIDNKIEKEIKNLKNVYLCHKPDVEGLERLIKTEII